VEKINSKEGLIIQDFEVRDPNLIRMSDEEVSHLKEEGVKIADDNKGKWFLSSSDPIYLPNHDVYYSMFTDRNRGVISSEVQTRIRGTEFIIFGVGSTGGDFATMIAQIGAENILIADMDRLDTSNLNRQHGSFRDIGKNKTDIVARRIWDINPYANVQVLNKRITTDDVDSIIDDSSLSSIILLAMDDKDSIIEVHRKAKEKGIPVFMATDIGHSAHLAIFDYNKPDSKIFNGKISLYEAQKISLLEFVTKFIKIKDLPNEYLDAAKGMLKGELKVIPQLTTASKKAGAKTVEEVISYFEGRKSKPYKMHNTRKAQSTRIQRLQDLLKKPKKIIELAKLKKGLSMSQYKSNTF
jgi:molybdopterin/thiamine biosynthesis adenylyltransferase